MNDLITTLTFHVDGPSCEQTFWLRTKTVSSFQTALSPPYLFDDVTRRFLKMANWWEFIVCVVLVISRAAALKADQRNVLVMIGDDYGLQSGVYGSQCKTPNIDALAKRGLLMEHAYTSVSSCSPSRSAILTGLPQHENGMYGLHGGVPNFQSFDQVQSLPLLINKTKHIRTGIIGKKHVGPDYVYPFEFAYTEENSDLMQVGRNITRMKELVRLFLKRYAKEQFFLYIGFHDPHRCNPGTLDLYGHFCERFGDGSSTETGVIPDWHPTEYNPDDLEVPYFLPNTSVTKQELANFYKTISRLDQGVGIMMQALIDFGVLNNTLIIFSSDNGIPFPAAKTNLYDPGMIEPFIISSPLSQSRWGQHSKALVGLTDITPTVLDWFDIPFPSYSITGEVRTVTLKGKSVLPLLEKEPVTGWDVVHSSHNIHEVTMYYPMRVIRTVNYKLIHNINFKMPYPIAEDLYLSSTFLDILNRTSKGEKTYWYRSLHQYYYRDEWELYDLETDPEELHNLSGESEYAEILKELQEQLHTWQDYTNDYWICLPGGKYDTGKCYPLDNGFKG